MLYNIIIILSDADPTFMPSANEHSLSFALCTGTEVSEVILNAKKISQECVMSSYLFSCNHSVNNNGSLSNDFSISEN